MKLITFEPQRPEAPTPGGVLRSSWQVSRRAVTLTQDVDACRHGLGAGMMRAEWSPDLPRKLSKHEWRAYREGRNAHHQRIANIIGGVVAYAE